MRALPGPRRRGFTVAEMAIASLMMVIVAALLANAWAVFGRSAISAMARARIAQEANLAAACLVQDVGLLARPANQPDSRYRNAQASPDGSSLTLTLDDGSGTLRTIRYAVDPANTANLVRTDLTAVPNTERVVATLAAGFQATALGLPNEFNVSGVQVDLTLTHRTYDRDPDGAFRGDHTRRFTLFVPDPGP